MENPKVEALKAHVARLELKIDALESWYTRLDERLKEIGFPEGVQTLVDACNGADLPDEE